MKVANNIYYSDIYGNLKHSFCHWTYNTCVPLPTVVLKHPLGVSDVTAKNNKVSRPKRVSDVTQLKMSRPKRVSDVTQLKMSRPKHLKDSLNYG